MIVDTIINRDALPALKELPAESVHCAVTSPPYYGLRDYGMDAQIGREDTPEEYIERLVCVFHELRRVLRSDGTFWLNIADTYCGTGSKGNHFDPKNPKGRNGQQVSVNHRAAGCKQKDLIGIPWLLAFALRSDGWYLRSDIIWQKDNPMPESVRDRPSRCYEHIFCPCCSCREQRRTSHAPGTAYRLYSVCRNNSACWNCTCGGLRSLRRKK